MTLAATVIFSAAFAVPIHDWYPGDCCGGDHCRPVACATMLIHPDGSLDWIGLHFTKDQVHASQDAGCHVCVGVMTTGRREPYCAFVATTM
jgi:hypothetical protein